MSSIHRSLLTPLILVAAGLLSAVTAHAQTVITALPYTITSGGADVLNANLGSSQTSGNLITVDAANVTIDFQDHYITGLAGSTSQSTIGVYASERSNITLKNGTISHCEYGLLLTGNGSATTNSVDHQVDNMRVTYCTFTGVEIVASPVSRVTNCQVSQTGDSGQGYAYRISASGNGVTV